MESTIEEVEKFVAKVDGAAERVFASASIWNRSPAKVGDPKIIAVLLLIRTLSNFRGTVNLLRADRIVEARTIARCCFENLFHIAALRNPQRVARSAPVRLKRPVQGRAVEGLGLVKMTRRHYRLKVGYGAIVLKNSASEIR